MSKLTRAVFCTQDCTLKTHHFKHTVTHVAVCLSDTDLSSETASTNQLAWWSGLQFCESAAPLASETPCWLTQRYLLGPLQTYNWILLKTIRPPASFREEFCCLFSLFSFQISPACLLLLTWTAEISFGLLGLNYPAQLPSSVNYMALAPSHGPS